MAQNLQGTSADQSLLNRIAAQQPLPMHSAFSTDERFSLGLDECGSGACIDSQNFLFHSSRGLRSPSTGVDALLEQLLLQHSHQHQVLEMSDQAMHVLHSGMEGPDCSAANAESQVGSFQLDEQLLASIPLEWPGLPGAQSLDLPEVPEVQPDLQTLTKAPDWTDSGIWLDTDTDTLDTPMEFLATGHTRKDPRGIEFEAALFSGEGSAENQVAALTLALLHRQGALQEKPRISSVMTAAVGDRPPLANQAMQGIETVAPWLTTETAAEAQLGRPPSPSKPCSNSGPRSSSSNSNSTRTSTSLRGIQGQSNSDSEDKTDWREKLKQAVRARAPALAAAEGHHSRIGFETPGTLAARLSLVVDSLASRKGAQEGSSCSDSTAAGARNVLSQAELKSRKRGPAGTAKEMAEGKAEHLGNMVRQRLRGVKERQVEATRPTLSHGALLVELPAAASTRETAGAAAPAQGWGGSYGDEDIISRDSKQPCRRGQTGALVTPGTHQQEIPGPTAVEILYSRTFLCASPNLANVPADQVRMWDPELLTGVSSQLMDLATAYTCHDLAKAEDTREWLQMLASPVGSVTQRLSFYVLSALDTRFKGGTNQASPCLDLMHPLPKGPASVMPYAKMGIQRIWGSFQENLMTQTLINALKGHKRVHILVLTGCSTPFWDVLFCALASQPEGKPESVHVSILIPGTGASQLPDLQQEYALLGEEVLHSAAKIGIRTHCKQVMFMPADFRPWEMVTVERGAALGVVAWLTLAAFPDGSLLSHNPRDTVLKWIRGFSPKVVTIIDCDSDFNSPFFLPRFRESVKRMEILLQNFDSVVYPQSSDAMRAANVFLEGVFALNFMNCVSFEGLQRHQRSERMDKWRHRMLKLGYQEQPFSAELMSTLQEAPSHRSFSVVDVKGFASLRWDGHPTDFAGSWTVP